MKVKRIKIEQNTKKLYQNYYNTLKKFDIISVC